MPFFLLGLVALGGHLIGNEIRRVERAATNDILALLTGEKKRAWVRTVPEKVVGHAFGNLRRVTIEAQDFSTPGLPFFTEPGGDSSGKVGELKLVLNRFRLGKLRVEHLEASIFDNRFDYALIKSKRQFRLSESGHGPGQAVLLDRDIAEFIPARIAEIKSCTVTFEGDKVRVKGRCEFAIIQSSFELIGSLEVRGGNQFWLKDVELSFDGRPADTYAKNALLRLLNPVLDLNRDLKLAGAIQVTTIQMQGDRLIASGDAKIPEKPKENP